MPIDFLQFFISMMIPGFPGLVLNFLILIFTWNFLRKRNIFGLKMMLFGIIGMLAIQVLSWYGNYYFYFSENSREPEVRALLTFYSIFQTVVHFSVRAIFVLGIYKTIQELMNDSADENDFLIRN